MSTTLGERLRGNPLIVGCRGGDRLTSLGHGFMGGGVGGGEGGGGGGRGAEHSGSVLMAQVGESTPPTTKVVTRPYS